MVGVSQNNYWQDVRGIEVTAETRFNKWFNARLDYSLSYSQTGIYGLQNAYRPGEDGTQFSLNTRWGANNHDGGNDANNNEYWNPNNSLKLSGNVFTPKDLGPRLGNTSLLGDWNLTFNYTYAQGFEYTYYSPDQIASGVPIIPNNRRWKPFHNTNLSLSKAIPVGSGLRAILSVKVINLFDQNQLRLPGNLQNWHELGLHNQRNIGSGDYQEKRDDVWRWYNFRQLPRMIYYSLSFEF
jgi:hypothetical protein